MAHSGSFTSPGEARLDLMELVEAANKAREQVKSLTSENERLQRSLHNANTELHELQNSDLGSLNNQVEKFSSVISTMTNELVNFLEANNFSQFDDRFQKFFDYISDGCMTSAEAIKNLRLEFSNLFDQSGSGINNQMFDELSSKINSMVGKVETLTEAIKMVGEGGNMSTAIEYLERIATSVDKIHASMGSLGSESKSVRSGVKETAEAFNDASLSIETSNEHVNTLRENLGTLHREFTNLNDVGAVLSSLGFSEQEISNIVSGLSDLNIAIEKITLKGFSSDNKAGVRATITGLTEDGKQAITVVEELGRKLQQATDAEGNSIKGLKEWVGYFSSSTQATQSVGAKTSAVKQQAEAYKELLSIQQKINSKELELLRGADDATKIRNISEELSVLSQRYKEVYSSAEHGFTAEQQESLNRAYVEGTHDVEELANALARKREQESDNNATKQQAEAYRELLSIQKQINSKELELLRGADDSTKIKNLSEELAVLSQRYQEVAEKASGNLTAEQQEALNRAYVEGTHDVEELANALARKREQESYDAAAKQQAEAINLAYKEQKSALQEIVNIQEKLANPKNLSTDEIDLYTKRLEELSQTYYKLIDETSGKLSPAQKQELAQIYERSAESLKHLTQQQREYNKAQNDSNIDKALTGEKKKQDNIRQTITEIKKLRAAQDAWSKAGIGSSSSQYTELGRLITQWENLRTRLEQGTISEKEFAAQSSALKTSFASISSDINLAGEQVQTFGKKLASIKDKFGYLLSASTILMRSISIFKQMANTAIEIDTAMNQLQIVTGATDTEMERFLSNAVDLSNELGNNITNVLSSMETFSRLGYSLSEASVLSRQAGILTNVAAVSQDEATTGLTAIIKGFNMQVEDASHVADVLTNVGQKYAVSARELMEAFTKSGAALNATGVSFEKSAALIAAANASIQNASTVGTALKTISARMRKSESELAELGESADDLAEGFSKYAGEIKALTGVDILVEGTTDTFRDLYDIFDEVSRVWDDLTDTQQARVSEIFGGTRQLQVISSIIGNWEDATRAYADAMDSAGVATNANNKYLETTAAHIEKFKVAFQELSQSTMTRDFMNFFVDLATQILKVVDNLGLARTALLAFTGVGIAKIATNFDSSIEFVLYGCEPIAA